MLKLWDYTFTDKMHIDCSSTNLLLTEAPLNPSSNRRTMAEIVFETFDFAGMKVELQATLALYAQGLMTGLIIDSGEGVTHCIPICEGNVFKSQIERIDIAGRDLTQYLLELLTRRGYNFNTSYDFEQVRDIKEATCFVSCNLEEDRELCKNTCAYDIDYKLPDGEWIRIGQERFEAVEALFKPHLIGRDEEGIAELVFRSVMKSPIDNRKALLASMILSGGTSMFPGMVDRLTGDIKNLYKQMRKQQNSIHGEKPTKVKIKIEDPPYRKFLVYMGGTAFARILQGKPEAWITKEQ